MSTRHHTATADPPLLLIPELALAHAATDALARHASPPLVFVHGPSGVGKTQLASQFVRTCRAGVHVTASQFAAELADASSRRSIAAFQEHYRQLDVLVCEDLQSLKGRSETQRQLVHVIDELTTGDGRVLLTATRPPGQINGLNPRLVNRLHGGVCAGVRPPGLASRVHLLEHFAATRQLPLRGDIARRLARALPVSPRELLAGIRQLDALARDVNGPVDDRLVDRLLRGHLAAATPSMPQVARAVARSFGVTVSSLKSRSREQRLVLPRHCAMYLCRELTGSVYRQIATYFGGRNHATALHACSRLQQQLQVQPDLRQQLHSIRSSLAGHERSAGE